MKLIVSKGVRGVCTVAVVAICVASCRGGISGLASQVLPPNATFMLGDISGMNYSGEHAKSKADGGMQLDIHNYTLGGDPSLTVFVLFIFTACGTFHASQLDITADRFIMAGVFNRFDAAACTSEQFAASEKIAALAASQPRYDYDGKRLRLKGDNITATFELVHKATS